MPADYYDILGVSRDASQDEIKAAYRQKAMQYHPDRSDEDGAEEKFKEVNEAYNVLSDPETRKRYDRAGQAGLGGQFGQQGRRAGSGAAMDFEAAFRQFMDEFEQTGQAQGGRQQGGLGGLGDLFFGQQARQRRQQGRQRQQQYQQATQGEDLKTTIQLSLPEVAHGTTRTVELPLYQPCSACEGGGTEKGTQPPQCDTCRGEGRVAREKRTMLGRHRTIETCPDCQGAGRQVKNPCSECQGEGRVQQTREFELDIPPGVDEDDYLRLRGQGHAGRQGGTRGDLYVGVRVVSEEGFQRRGQTLILDRGISYSTAALGGTIQVETVDGTAEVEVPAGLQDGQAVRLSGKGLPPVGGGKRGDQLVRLHVWVPTHPKGKERELLEKLREVESEPPDRPPFS